VGPLYGLLSLTIKKFALVLEGKKMSKGAKGVPTWHMQMVVGPT